MSAAHDREITPLDTAVRIGRTLCEHAHWDREGRLCNWIGRSRVELSRDNMTITPCAAALGPDLYGGSAGVALFLAQLHALTGDPAFRTTALGGIARSWVQFQRVPAAELTGLSLFSGPLGVAFVADRVAARIAPETNPVDVEAVLDQVMSEADSPHLLDLISGNAGAIPALLALSRTAARPRCLELAVSLGEELSRKADRRGELWSWDTKSTSGTGLGDTPQTGLSHGASGIGLALFELHAATGRTDFLEAALGAFAYEDSFLDPQQGHWADLRFVDEAAPAPRSPGDLDSYSAWCHGASGIGLARLRAAALDPPRRESHIAKARLAVATTLRAIEKRLAVPRSDSSLCHGLMGLAEVVLIAGQLLEDEAYHAAAAAAARVLIARYSETGDWPSGAPSAGPNPSLMLGTAGIGYTLLRLHDPAGVPPILLLLQGYAKGSRGRQDGS